MPKILIIDDDQDFSSFLTKLIKAKGYEVETSHDSLEAVHHVLTDNPDVVLLDIRLGQDDGVSVFRTLKSYHKTQHIPIVFMSSFSHELERASSSRSIHAEGFFKKPVDSEKLLAKIEALVGQPAS